jgi:outer membrane protein TolC
MSCRRLVTMIALGTIALGCERQCYLSQADFNNAQIRGMPPRLECDTLVSTLPPHGSTPAPTTVDETQRAPRYLSLHEALAIALENGTIGTQSPVTPGFGIDTLGAFSGTLVQSADAIRVLALDPAIVATEIELSLSKFDVQWNTSLVWNHAETPLGTSPVISTGTTAGTTPGVPTGATAGTGTSGVTSVTADSTTFSSGLFKPLPTGGVAGVTFDVNYLNNSPPGRINPAIQPSLQFGFEQPLLQGYGVEINQLLPTHANSTLLPLVTGNTGEGIIITRIRFDQQRAEFERNLNFLLLNVEAAYWNLWGAYYQLYSREEGLRYAFESWRLTRLGFEAGRAAEQDLEQARLQYEQFRSQRMTALGQVLESERQLRNLLGMRIDDGFRLVPTDSPTLTPYRPNWQEALDLALAGRPELVLARQDVKFRQLDLIRQRNALLPDLRFVASDTIHSIGSQLDGGEDPNNALHNLVSDPFNDWSLGLRLNVPIGFRAANSNVRAARLNLQRSYLSLTTEENKAELFLGLAYRQVFEFQRQVQINQAALRAATRQLEAYYELFRLGRARPFGADLILAQQNWSNSAAALYTAIVQYNNALATLEFAKGTIRERDSILISDGPAPKCVQVRAVEHERQKTEAVLLRERALTGLPQSCCSGTDVPVPHLPVDAVVPVPTLQQNQPPVPELPVTPAGR